MMNVEQGIGWRNANNYRAYPFRDDVDMTVTSTLTGHTAPLPTNVILDVSGVLYDDANSTFALISVGKYDITSMYATFKLGAHTVQVVVPIGASLLAPVVVRSSHYRLSVVFGDGIFELTWDNDTQCNIPVQPALLLVQNNTRVTLVGGQTGNTIIGRVNVLEGYNCRLTLLAGEIPVLRISAVYGAGAGVPCAALTGDVRQCQDTLLRINGLAGATSGDFMLLGGPGVTVTSDPDTQTITITGLRKYNRLGCSDVPA